MTDPTTTPGDEQTATLLVDRTSSTCGGCGQPTLPSALTHANVSGYEPKPGGGCGARFVAIRSVNRAVTEGHLRSLRPDLPVDSGREQQMTATPGTMPPDMVNAIVRDMDDPRYPSKISVYCDECGVTHTGEYMVSAEMTSMQRLAVARKHLVDHKGWECTADLEDFCPEHAGSTK